MPVSNSKLTPAEKAILKAYRAEQSGTMVYRNLTTTLVARFNSQLVRFSSSVRSPDEHRFRNKVGEYHARSRFDYGEVSILTTTDFYDMVNACNFKQTIK